MHDRYGQLGLQLRYPRIPLGELGPEFASLPPPRQT